MTAVASEGMLEVPGGRVWYRSVGEGGVPLLCLHGGPGAPHDYLEPLEALASRRRVIFYDQLGCGNSDLTEDTSLFTVERFVRELDAVRDGLGLDRVHLFGSSWGGMLAMQYTLDRPQRPPVSLVMAGSPASSPRWNAICQELLEEMPEDERAEIERLEAADMMDSPEYEEAMMPFYRRHVCRMDPWPDYVVRGFDRLAKVVYHYMAGPSEFRIIGTLRDWDIMDRLGEIRVPTLITGGEFDECRPVHLKEIHARIPGSRLEIIPDASHLCFAERPDIWMPLVDGFLAEADAQ
jgi:proline-specific peptidase